MWISRNIAYMDTDEGMINTGASNSGIDTRIASVSGDGSRQCELINPPGIVSVPASEDDVVVINTKSGLMCLGVRTPYFGKDVEAGDVLIRSGTHASIRLSTDGSIRVTGKLYLNEEEV